MTPVTSNHGSDIRSAAPARRRGSASRVCSRKSFICLEYPTLLRLSSRLKLILSSSPSRLMGVSAMFRKG